jgi:TonB family protein
MNAFQDETKKPEHQNMGTETKVQGLSLAASVGLHLVVFGLLSLNLSQKALLVGSIKGSPTAAIVYFDVIEAPAQDLKQPLPAIKDQLTDENSEVIVSKKKPRPKVKAAALKLAKKQPTPSTQDFSEATSAGRPGTAGPLGFDLRNVEGNLSPELQKYFTTLRMDIEKRKRYPKLAKRLRQSGRVVLKFQIGKEGKIKNVLVEEPSPFRALNESAKKLVSNLKGEYPLPLAIKAERIEIKLPVSYKL